MNVERRKQIARLVHALAEAKKELEDIRDKEGEAFGNLSLGTMSSNLQRTPRGQQALTAFTALGDAVSGLDEVLNKLRAAAE